VKLGKKSVLLVALGVLHLLILLAGFIAPYDSSEQNRDLPFAPPSRIHFADAHGTFHLRPYVCSLKSSVSAFGQYVENRTQCSSIYFLTRGSPYELFGLFKSNVHLFEAIPPARIFLMGTDAYGRDQFSRFLFGGRVSLFAGIAATVLSLFLGTVLGTIAGYYGAGIDTIIMRGAELFLALPWLYLLLALRAFLPLNLGATEAFLLLVGVIGLVGWARPARLIRGVVLSSRERHYVLAARLFGGSDAYLIRRHILSDIYGILLTQVVLLIPQYILAEVTLSFLGLGVAEPAPTWGNMLTALQQYSVLVSHWWMLMPGLALVPVFLAYVLLASELQPMQAVTRG
jgi:peptide/nickel transport system permease protein